MVTRSLLILFCLLINGFISWGQSTSKTALTVKEFSDNPWPFEPSLANMLENYGEHLKKEKYVVRNRFEKSQKDTIIRLFKGKNEIFFYQPFNGKPLFLAANVFDKRIKLKADISTGMFSKELFNRISYPDTGYDTIKISLPEGAYKTSFVIKDKKIFQIKIEARNKNR